MESDKLSLRFILADQEDQLQWTSVVSKASLKEALTYLSEQQRKKFSSDELAYMDTDDRALTLDDIIEFGNSPVFVTAVDRTDVTTDKETGPRNNRNVYEFKDAETVRIQKFENLKKAEEITMKVTILKILNDGSKKKKYNSQQVRDNAQAKKDILNAGGISLNNPLNFVSTGDDKATEKFIEEDLKVRKKVAMQHGNDGWSQAGFYKLEGTGKVENRGYTLDEVKKHRTRQDAWIIIDNKIYDITQYIPFHPGGDKILMGVGKDGTELFNRYHAWVNAHFMLAKFQVGYLIK